MTRRDLSAHRAIYELRYRHGMPEHCWSVRGATNGAHLSIRECEEDRFCGGIEYHRGTPKVGDRAPDHDNCWLIRRPCWHDGSSLQVEEYWIPLWLSDPGNHEAILLQLIGWMKRQETER